MGRCVLLSSLLLLLTCFHSFNFQAVEQEDLADILDLFKGLDSVLKYFRNSTDQLAQNILTTFERECFFTTEPVVPSQEDPSRRPFIVIEGNNRPSRDRVGVSLARILNGRYFNNPAPCLIRYLEELPSGSFLRRAYFVLSLYATDFNVRVQLAAGHPVVVNGCWLDQLVFALEKTYQDLPEVTSELFTWPSDLLRPDMTFFLSSSLRYRGNAFTPRVTNQHQNRSLEMYRRLQRRFPIMILDRNVRAEVIHNHLIRILSHKRDLTSKDTDEDVEVRLQLFAGLRGILNFFRNNSNILAQRILETFEKDCMFNLTKPIPVGGSRKPFVVLEGNGHNSRDNIGKSLARKMNARYMVHPASCLVKYMDVLPKASLLRRAYYILSLYAVSHSVKAHLSTNKAVVLNGYWHDQLTFSVAQVSRPGNLLDVTSDQFRMPDELLPPDLIIYLLSNVDSLAENRASASVYTSTLEMYKSLQAFYPIVIEEVTTEDRTTTANVFKHVRERLAGSRHVVEQEYDEVTDVLHLFTGLRPVVEYFQKSSHPFAKEIVSTFEQYWSSFIEEPENVARNPFIVIEGNNRTSRDAISFRLAKMLGGEYVKHPAPCLRDFMYTLPSGSLLRRAYYLLSLYATSLDVRRQTRITPVVVNGFWLDQLTFALIQSFQYGRLPRVTTPIFRWPLELLRPDLIFYLNHPDHLDQHPFIRRSHNNWKPRSLELYRKLASVYNVTVVNVQQEYWNTAAEIYKSITKTDLSQGNETQNVLANT